MLEIDLIGRAANRPRPLGSPPFSGLLSIHMHFSFGGSHPKKPTREIKTVIR